MNSSRNVELPLGKVNDFHWEFKPVELLRKYSMHVW